MIEIPSATPFEIPLCTVTATLRLARPWTLPPTPSTSPTTSLRGLVGDVLASAPDLASLSARFKHPPTRLYQKGLLPSFVVYAETTGDPSTVGLRALLRGHGAPALVEMLGVALDRAGRVGLEHRERNASQEHRISFSLHELDADHRDAASRIRERLPAVAPSRALVEFLTPCNATPLTPADIAGNLACGLVKLHLALSDEGARSKRDVDADADAARDAARAAFAHVTVTRSAMYEAPRGQRYSGETGEVFSLGGRLGTLTLEGDLTDALPWLLLMELHGVGGNTAFGMGRFRLWGA